MINSGFLPLRQQCGVRAQLTPCLLLFYFFFKSLVIIPIIVRHYTSEWTVQAASTCVDKSQAHTEISTRGGFEWEGNRTESRRANECRFDVFSIYGFTQWGKRRTDLVGRHYYCYTLLLLLLYPFQNSLFADQPLQISNKQPPERP